MLDARRMVLGALLATATSCGGVDGSDLLGAQGSPGGVSGATTDGGGASGGSAGAPSGGAAGAGVCGTCPAPPAHAIAACDGTQCSFVCNTGFVRDANACSPVGDAGHGTGGVDGAAGSTASAGGTAGVTGAGGVGGVGGVAGAGGAGLTTCPAVSPKSGDVCLNFSLSCPYGATTCSCLLVFMLPVWACR